MAAPPDLPYTRLLVSHRWPRGARGTVDQGEPALGLTPALLATADGDLAAQYREALAASAHLVRWAARMALANGVTLLVADEAEAGALGILADAVREAAEAMA